MTEDRHSSKYKTVDLVPKGGDDSGWLISIESRGQIPFEIKRVYYIFGTLPGIRRGMHAHKNLEQLVICISGRCTFTVDDGTTRELFRLDSPQRGLYLQGVVWREMSHFSNDCVLLVLASEKFNNCDYIRDYQSFLEYVKGAMRSE